MGREKNCKKWSMSKNSNHYYMDSKHAHARTHTHTHTHMNSFANNRIYKSVINFSIFWYRRHIPKKLKGEKRDQCGVKLFKKSFKEY